MVIFMLWIYRKLIVMDVELKRRGNYINELFIAVLALFLLCLSACSNSPEQLVREFSKYKELEGLDVLLQTTPQPVANSLLAFYETIDHKFGVVEFDGDNNLKSEKRIENITISTR